MVLGIDASNIKAGGGLTNLIEFLNHANPEDADFKKVIVWGGHQLDKLPNKGWLEKRKEPLLSKGSFIYDTYWKIGVFKKLASEADLIFAPGGTLSLKKIPYVSMSQNMLVFEEKERARYGKFTLMYLRLRLLEYIQMKSFRNADSVIFISKYAKNYIIKKKKADWLAKSPVIYSGISKRFNADVKTQQDISNYNKQNPFKILYVSVISEYKHQNNVVAAVNELLILKYPIEISFVGPKGSEMFFTQFQESLNLISAKDRHNVKYYESVPYESINEFYQNTDLSIFASSCENMPNILIEAMSAGLPIVSSNLGPMPEFLKNSAIFFDPNIVCEIVIALKKILDNPKLRYDNALQSKEIAASFSWEKNADEMFKYFAATIKKNKPPCAEL